MNAPKVTVTVPIRNYGRYLRRCLDALVAQTLTDIEILCVDAGSTDDAPQIAAEYAAKDPRIRLIRLGPVGVASARNAALDAARAPYLMSCDADDWAEPTWCEELYAAVTSSGADLAVARAFIDGECPARQRAVLEGHQRLKYSGVQEASVEMVERVDPAVWIKIFRLDVIRREGLRFPDGAVYEDWLFSVEYLSVVRRVAFLDRRLYHYVQHAGSILNGGVDRTARALDWVGNWKRLHSFLSSRGTLQSFWRGRFWEDFVRAVRRANGDDSPVAPEVQADAAAFVASLPASAFDGASPGTRPALDLLRRRALNELRSEKRTFCGVTIWKYKRTVTEARAYLFGLRLYKRTYA